MADFKPTAIKHAINEKKLQLFALNASGKSASLKFNMSKNYPRIDVYTNDDSDPKSKESIRANLDQPSFFLLLEMLKSAVHSKEPMEECLEIKSFVYFGKQRSEKPEVTARVSVGRNEKGVVFICVAAKGRPKIKFPVVPSNWIYLIDVATGEKLDEAKASTRCAAAWCTMLSEMVSTYLILNFVEDAPKEEQSGGKSYGNNNSGGGGNQWQNKQNSAPAASSYDMDGGDDGLPF